jgi:hypothetical protein
MRPFLLFAAATAFAFQGAGPALRPLPLRAPLQDKNFYLLSLIERDDAVKSAIRRDPVLAAATAKRREGVDRAVADCALDLECYAAKFRFTPEQVEETSHALTSLYERTPAMRALVDGELRISGAYYRHRELSGPDLLAKAWTECAGGINHAIDVYTLGKPPRYPAIDSITYDPKSAAWQRIVQHAAAILQEDRAALDLPHTASLRFALQMMTLNHRDEAARYEPLENGENRAASQHARSIDWSRYPYTAIVVPGSGNDRPGVHLSPNGMLRDEIAVRRFREGKAPFILVSGGHVHPNQTEYSEAIEMKRDLMTRFGIPEEAIIVDPHARHTTTNMRNAARLMYRYGIPLDRKALISTDLSQSTYIENPDFGKRCIAELGYVPHKLLQRVSPFDIEFIPSIESLHIDPLDPLDP